MNPDTIKSQSVVQQALNSLHGVVMQQKEREAAIRAVAEVGDCYGLRYGSTERDRFARVAGEIVNRYHPEPA